MVITQCGLIKMHRSMCFEETRPGRDVFHQRHDREDNSGHCACALMRGMRFAQSGPGRVRVYVTDRYSIHGTTALYTTD